MQAADIVARFDELLVECEWALKSRYQGASRTSETARLTLVGADGRTRTDSGVIDGFGTFRLHGAGCRFDLTGGGVVDFDWDAQGRMVFDAWRLAEFARSIGFADMSEDSLREAARFADGLTECRPGWFTHALS